MARRAARRIVEAQRRRVARIIAKVRAHAVVTEASSPEALITEVQREAERLTRAGTLRADELRDLKSFHATMLRQMLEQRQQEAKAAAERIKLG